jgi:CRP/FNR family transcriptional regulator, cyclic AMP receptor protein
MVTNSRAILEIHPFLEGLRSDHLEAVLGCTTSVNFKAGEYACQSDEAATAFYLITQGEVVVEVPQSRHASPTIIQTLRDGDVFGWSWLFPPYRWHLPARATKDTQTLAIDGAAIRKLMEADPEFGYIITQRFAKLLVRRLQGMLLRMADE